MKIRYSLLSLAIGAIAAVSAITPSSAHFQNYVASSFKL